MSRYWLLLVSSIVLVVAGIFSFTPISWDMGGRESESYPELFFAFYVLPPSIMLFVVGVLIALLGDPRRGGIYRRNNNILWVSAAFISVVATLVAVVSLGFIGDYPDWVARGILYQYPLVGYPVMLVMIATGAVVGFRKDRA